MKESAEYAIAINEAFDNTSDEEIITQVAYVYLSSWQIFLLLLKSLRFKLTHL